MADRYWVGGAGNWSSTTKWSTSSGGASGASVPTSADNAIFDANSGGKFVATVDTAQQVNSLAITPSSGAGLLTISLTAPLTTGALTTSGTAGNNRIFFTSTTYGISIDFVVTGAVSISDCDFRGVYVTGASAPISGTRIGNRGECRNITFSTPKTVYWNLAGAQNWSANAWATTSTGTPSTDNFPLPQDTATFTNSGSVTGTITLDAAIAYVPNVDMSGRSTAMTLGTSNATTVHGNWTNGSGTAFTGTAALTFSGGTTQTITSAGKTFTCPITINTYGGTVQLADALNTGSNNLTVTNGTFDTAGYAIVANSLSSSNSNVRTIKLGASSITLTSTFGLSLATTTNLTFDAGTSNITVSLSSSGSMTIAHSGITLYNVTYTNAVSFPFTYNITGSSVYNNLTFTVTSASALIHTVAFSDNQTINGTLTCSGASAVRRIFLQSNTVGTQRTLIAAAISATDCDFRDINLSGTASGASPTRAGDCGGNSGITFPAPKTVYWNFAGAQNWSATGWATSSGGTPAANNFPLAQDTAVFDNTGSVTGVITINANYNIGTFDASLRTSAMTLTTSTNTPTVYGDWKFGTGVTSSSTAGTITFSSPATETITSNGVQFGCPVTVNHPSGTVQLADALSLGSTRTLTLTAGTFDAITYNVTVGVFSSSSGSTTKMGTGTWTLSGTGTVWTGAGTNIAGTSTIVLSDTSTTARTFAGGSLYYNKLTIGGTTGTSTLTITGANTFGELASTKTVAHTITFPSSTTTTIGKWSVTGTVGNVVTVNSSTAATAFTLSLAGPANSGIDYLSVRDCTLDTASPGEFYVGANSTNVSGNTRVIFTATPTSRTLYWVGGTGNWSATTSWATSSGGASGAAIPTSLDAVNFNSASNATAYTAAIDAGVTIARCASFTMAGPASGNVTFAGTVGIAFHGNVSFAATGITKTNTGDWYLSGNSAYTVTTNGIAFGNTTFVSGVGATWTLGSALSVLNNININYGSLNTSSSNYAVSCGFFNSNNSNVRGATLNGSTITVTSSSPAVNFTTVGNFTFNAGTSQINITNTTGALTGGGVTFNNVSFTNAAATSVTISGANTFNTLSFAGRTTVGITPVTFNANQTISTLTLNAGTAAAYRTFLASNAIGTQRTLTVTTLTAGAADYDFRDIAITGGAAPLTGTRFGDAKGNSGITFPVAKTVYYRNTGSANWGTANTGSWSATSGGAADATQFPLAQDTAIFPAATYPASGSTTTINASYNIGTIDMSLRTTNTMTLATGTTTPQIYGNWINGTGTTLTGSGAMTFAGRGSQTITSAGRTFTQSFTINNPGGSVTLQDALIAGSFSHLAGTFDAVTYNVTLTSTGTAGIASTGSATRTLAFGSGTWTSSAAGSPAASFVNTGLTVTGTGTISLTSASAKTFAGGGLSYSGITLDQGGAGTLTISGNNTFKDITNTYSATGATSIALGNTTQTLTNPWTATGAAGKVLTVSGTSAASPGTLIFSGSGTAANVDYLAINNVRAYDLTNEWYAGTNSTNGGSLGWYFIAAGGTVYAVTITETGTGTDSISAGFLYLGTVSDTASGSDSMNGNPRFVGSVIEVGTGSDSVSAIRTMRPVIAESATVTDADLARLVAKAILSETATGTDTDSAIFTARSSVAETTTATDLVNAPGSTYNAPVLELSTLQDAARAFATFPVAVTEAATGSQTNSAAFIPYAQITESATITDVASALAAFAARAAESASAADAVLVAPSVFNAVALASAQAVDNFNPAGSVYNAPVLESATISDSLIGGFLWNLINDSQTSNWSAVNNAQASTWTSIDDTQSPNWQNIQTLN